MRLAISETALIVEDRLDLIFYLFPTTVLVDNSSLLMPVTSSALNSYPRNLPSKVLKYREAADDIYTYIWELEQYKFLNSHKKNNNNNKFLPSFALPLNTNSCKLIKSISY